MRFKVIISLILVWLVVLLGVFLRGFRADRYPVDNNDDGLFYVWAGSSFLDNPLKITSHSIFETDNPALIWRSQFMDYIPLERFGMKIVRPWFDHPPLGAILAAIPAKILGYVNLEQIPHLIVRYPALVASILTLFLTYILAEKLFKKRVAFLSLVFLATIPYFVIAHRQSFLENFLTPLWLAGLIFLLRFLEKKSSQDLMVVVIVGFLSGWFKITGFSIPIMLAGWLWYKKQKKPGLMVAGAGLLSGLLYWTYGLVTNAQVFSQTLANQGIRGAFLSSFFFGLTRPEFYGEFNDGWYILGFLLSFWLALKHKKESTKFFGWFFTGWLLVLFLTAGRLANSPWYRYPLIPFMAMAIGYYINKLLKNNQVFWVLPLYLLGLTGLDLAGIEISASLVRMGTILFFAPYLMQLIWQKKIFRTASYWLTRIFLVSVVILNIYVSLIFSQVQCQRERCLAPQKIVIDEK